MSSQASAVDGSSGIGGLCWIPDDQDVYRLVKIIREDTSGGKYQVAQYNLASHSASEKTVTISNVGTHPVSHVEELSSPPSDLIQLYDVHPPGILHALRTRFIRNLIYTSIGPILVSINPFKVVPGIYDDSVKQKYADGEMNLADNPHLFAMAHDAHVGLQLGKNQSLVISGESGAGKTEATKHCLNYLASVAGSSQGLQDKVLQASPILEAWGNAKTIRNNNSSRFGKFIEIWFGESFDIQGSLNTTYLLEKSRVVMQDVDERNYHIFYMLLFGAPDAVKAELVLEGFAKSPASVNFVNQSGCLAVEGVDERKEFAILDHAMKVMGFSEDDVMTLFRTVAAILHLGNVKFEIDPNDADACQFTEKSIVHHLTASELLGLDPSAFKTALLYKVVRSGNRKSFVYVPFDLASALENRNALAKELYSRCFDWVVTAINSKLKYQTDKLPAGGMIGILDIFGFEVFKKNSFEQLCINLANEALQQHFNTNIFEHEMEIYKSEGITIPTLAYSDNADVLDLLTKKPKGLVPMLNEEGQIPKGTVDGFFNKFTREHANNPRLKFKPGLKEFCIIHYAGEVRYDPALFLVKNKDTLSSDMVSIMAQSTIPLLSTLFTEEAPEMNMSSPMRFRDASAAANKQTVGSRFKQQLDTLISRLSSTEPKYIRCVKPNNEKKPNLLDPVLTNEQLRYIGVFEAVIIMQNGFPFRLTHSEFSSRYHMLALKGHAWSSMFKQNNGLGSPFREHALCKAIVQSASANVDECLSNCHVGKTMVFYRAEQNRVLERSRKTLWAESRVIVQTHSRGFVVKRLIRRILSHRSATAKYLINGDMANLKVHKDSLRTNCTTFATITGVSLFANLLALSDAYFSASELLKSVEKSLKDLLARREHRDGMLPHYEPLKVEIERSKDIYFNEDFEGNRIIITWTQSSIILDAMKEFERLSIIREIKANLQSGITANDELHLIEWMEKMSSHRVSGLVFGSYCADEERRASEIIEIAGRQFKDFIGAVAVPIADGRFSYSINDDGLGGTDIEYSVNPKALVSYVERNTKMNMLSNVAMKIRISLELCEKLCDLRLIASEEPIDWHTMWEALQPWKLYFSEATKASLLKRRASLISPQDAVTGPNRRGSVVVKHIIPDATADKVAGAIPFVPELVGHVSNEIQGMAACCLEAIHFKQMQNEISSCCVPQRVTYGDLNIPLDSINRILTLMQGQTGYFTASQLVRYNDARARYGLRKGVCSRSAVELGQAIEAAEALLPPNDTELIDARTFFEFYSSEENLQTTLKECGPSGAPGELNFGDIETKGMSTALKKCSQLSVSDGMGASSKNGWSEWKKIITACSMVNEVRVLLKDEKYSDALALIDRFLFSEPLVSVNDNLQLELAPLRNDLKSYLAAVVNTCVSSPEDILAQVETSQLPQTLFFQFDEERHFDPLHPGNEAVQRAIFELNRYKDEIRHNFALDVVNQSLLQGSLVGAVGELDTSLACGDAILEALLNSSEQLIVSAKTVTALKSFCGLCYLRSCAKVSDWEAILLFFKLASQQLDPDVDIQTTFASLNDIFYEPTRKEYRVFFEEAMDLQTRLRLIASFNEGRIVFNSITGDSNVEDISTDALAVAIEFAESREEKSTESVYLLNSAKLLFCLRCRVKAHIWEAIDSDLIFNCPLIMNGPSEELLSTMLDKLTELKATYSIADYEDGVVDRLRTLFLAWNRFQMNEYGLTGAAVNKAEYIESILNTSIDSLIYFAEYSSGSHDRANASDLIGFAFSNGFHESISEEIHSVARSYQERIAKRCLILSSLINCIQGRMHELDSSSVALDKLSKSVELMWFYMQTNSYSESARKYYKLATFLLNLRLAVCSMSEGVNILTYFNEDTLVGILAELDDIAFPKAEATLVIEHIIDAMNIKSITAALLHGPPQIYMGKFDVKNVAFDHIICHVRTAKKLSLPSDRLDRLMFYAELCVKLRKALINQLWESEDKEQLDSLQWGSNTDVDPFSADPISVQRCLQDYSTASVYFQRRIPGVPPQCLIDEFEMVKTEVERRHIVQGFHLAFQSGKFHGSAGALELRDVDYSQLCVQIEAANKWRMTSSIDDGDLRQLSAAAEEVISIRKSLLAIHSRYKSTGILSSDEFVEASIKSNKSTLANIVEGCFFIDNAVKSAIGRVERLQEDPLVMVEEWRDVEMHLAGAEVSGRLTSFRNQLDVLVLETFERGFINRVLKIIRNIRDPSGFSNPQDKCMSVSRSLRGLCKAYSLKRSEITKSNNSSAKFSERCNVLYASGIVLIALYESDVDASKYTYSRDWLTKSEGVGPSFYELEQSIIGSERPSAAIPIHEIVSSLSRHCPDVHPAVINEMERFVRLVEDRISYLELTEFIRQTSSLSLTDNFNIDETEGRDILLRIEEKTAKEIKHLSYLTDYIDSEVNLRYTKEPVPSFLKYHSELTPLAVAFIDMTTVWDESSSESDIENVKADASELNRLLESHLKVVSDAVTYLGHSVEVVQLYYSALLLHKLHVLLKSDSIAEAFNVLRCEVAGCGGNPAETFRFISNFEYKLHPLAIAEFGRIAAMICDQYWRQVAVAALSYGSVKGSRGRIDLYSISWESIDEVLSILNGFSSLSQNTEVLRDLCVVVRYMRQSSLPGGMPLEDTKGNGTIVAAGDVDRDLTLDDERDAYINECISNALEVVEALSANAIGPNETYTKSAEMSLAAAERVKLCLSRISHDVASIEFASKLRSECDLVSEHCRFILAANALERAFGMEGIWFSYSSSNLEISMESFHMLLEAVQGTATLRLLHWRSAEMKSALLHVAAVRILAVMYHFLKVKDKADTELSGNCRKFLKKQLGVQVERSQLSQLLRLAINGLDDLTHIYDQNANELTRVIGNYKFAFEAALQENGKINTLLAIIKGSLEPNKSDGFYLESLMDASSTPAGPSRRIMASFRGDIMWRLAGLHVLLRRAVEAQEWSKVEPLANAIALSDVFNVRSEAAEDARQACKCVKIQRMMEVAISSCVFPQFLGWTSLESFSSVAKDICDYPLRASIHNTLEYHRKRSEEGISNPFQKFPVITELLTIAKGVIDVVNNLRCHRWKSSIAEDAAGKQVESTSSPDITEGNASMGAETLDFVTSALDEQSAAANKFCFFSNSVDASVQFLSDIIARSSLLSSDYGVGLALTVFVNRIKAELLCNELIMEAKRMLPIEIDKVSLIPSEFYYNSIKTYVEQKSASFEFQNYVSKCIVLRRYFQSFKLLFSAWELQTRKSGSHSFDFDDIVRLYEYVVEIPWIDVGEIGRASHMHSENVDINVVMEMSESDFVDSITARAQTLQSVELPEPENSESCTVELEASCSKIFQCPVRYAVTLLPDFVALFDSLRFRHNIDCANKLFDMELAVPKCAKGVAGDLDTSSVQVMNLLKIERLLVRAGVKEESSHPASYLLRAASSIGEIRTLQKSASYFYQANSLQNESQAAILKRFADVLEIAENYLELEAQMTRSEAESSDSRRISYMQFFSEELKTARLDFHQRKIILSLCSALKTHQISVLDREDDIGCFDLISSPILSNVSNEQLNSALSQCGELDQSIFSPRVNVIYKIAKATQQIRAMFISQNWDEVIEFCNNFEISSVALYPKDEFYLSFLKEFEDASRIAITLRAFELADYALSSGTLVDFEIGAVLDSKLNILSVTKSQELISKNPEKWATGAVKIRRNSLHIAFRMRTLAMNSQWERLYEFSIINLNENFDGLLMIKDCTRSELEAAKAQSAYYFSESILVNALSNPWRLKGTVGFVDETCLSVQVVRDAIEKVENMGAAHHEYINLLQTSARIINDLRSAQMRGAWVSSKSLSLKDFQNFQRSPEFDLVSCSIPVLDDALKSLDSKEIPTEDEIRKRHILPFSWLVANAQLDKDLMVTSSEPLNDEESDVAVSVADVLEGASFVEDEIGLASEALDEIRFARDEMEYRKIVSLLVEVISRPLLEGEPGALEIKSPDDSADGTSISLHDAIDIAESFPQVSLTNNAKWLLRDAKLLYRLIQSRREGDWDALQELLMEAADQNDTETMDSQSDPKLSIMPSGAGVIESQSNRLVHQPISSPIWSQVLILKADLNFYLCLADFAAELSEANQNDSLEYGEDRQRVTKLIEIMLKTRATSVIWPGTEFNRLIEAQELAIELRSRAYFDTESLPRDIVKKIRDISNICHSEGKLSYVDLVLPDANDYMLRSEIKELVINLDHALGSGAKYLMCPIGQINAEDMELDSLGEAVNACLLYRLDMVGSDEEKRLVRLGNLMHELRRKASEKRWDDVLNLVKSEERLLSSRLSASEEIARLEIEAKNYKAETILRNALCLGRFTNILDLVKQISKHKVMGTSVDELSQGGDTDSGQKRRRASMTLRSRDSMVNKRRDSLWRTIMSADVVSESLPEAEKEGLSARGLEKLNNAINSAMAVSHKSDLTSRLLKAAVLIQSLRSAIYGGFWDEVEHIVSDESQYRDPKIPFETIEEIKVAKAALYYRNCMASISKGLIAGRVTGSPGRVNLSSIDCLLLQSAISQAKQLEIDADPGALAMLDIAAHVCKLRDAAMAGRWIHEAVTDNAPESIETPTDSLVASEKKKLVTVSDLIVIIRNKLMTLPMNWEDDIAIEIKVSTSVGASIVLEEEKSILNDNTLDWIVLQGRALVSVKQELDLLEENMKDKLRQDNIAFALETVPQALVLFRTGGMTGLSINSTSSRTQNTDLFLVDSLSESLIAAKEIGGTVTEATERLYRTADVVLSFRMAMRDADTVTFKQLISRAQEMMTANLLSDRYGVMELTTYCSAAMTMNISRAEFMKSIRSGAMKGSILSPNLESIELHSLDKWILTYGSGNSDAITSLKSISYEASLLLSLRKLCKATRWLDLNTQIDALLTSSNKPQYILEEISFMRLVADYNLHIKQIVSELSKAFMPHTPDNQLSYIRLRQSDMARANQAASEILEFLTSKNLVQIEKLVSRTESNSKRDAKEFETLVTEENANLALMCLSIQKVSCLWNVVLSQRWAEHDLSIGEVHLFSTPHDKFLSMFFSLIQEQRNQRSSAASSTTETDTDGTQSKGELRRKSSAAPSDVTFSTVLLENSESLKLKEDFATDDKLNFSTIAQLLCVENWNGYPEFCTNQYNAIRDTMVDKVILLRIILGCLHGRAKQAQDGSIATQDMDMHLLKIALADVRAVTSWSSQNRTSFMFSSKTNSAIQCAKGLLSCREAVINDHHDVLLKELIRLKYVTEAMSRSRLELPTYYVCDETDAEFRHLQKLACEQYSLLRTRSAVCHILSSKAINMSLIQSSVIKSLGSAEMIGISPGEPITPMHEYILMLGSSIKRAVLASYSGNPEKVDLERSASISLVSELPMQEEVSLGLFELLFDHLARSANASIAPVDQIENNVSYIKSQLLAVEPEIPVHASSDAIEKTMGILHHFYITFLNTAATEPNFIIPSDVYDELKANAKELEKHYAIVVDPDPWLYLGVSLILVACEPSYNRHISGHFIHLVDISVGEFLRDSGVKLSAHSPPVTLFEHRGVLSSEEFHPLFTVTSVSAFLRRLIRSKLLFSGSSAALSINTTQPKKLNSDSISYLKVCIQTASKLMSRKAGAPEAEILRADGERFESQCDSLIACVDDEVSKINSVDHNTKAVKNAVSKRRKQLSN